MKIFEELKLPMNLVVGKTSDAAGPLLNLKDTKNTGKIVASMVTRKHNPKLFQQHYSAHRPEC